MADCLTYHYDSARSGQNGSFPFPGAPPWWRKYAVIPASAAVRGAPLLYRMTFQGGPHNGQTFNVLFVTTSDNQVAASRPCDFTI